MNLGMANCAAVLSHHHSENNTGKGNSRKMLFDVFYLSVTLFYNFSVTVKCYNIQQDIMIFRAPDMALTW